MYGCSYHRVNRMYPDVIHRVITAGRDVEIQRPDAVDSLTRELHPAFVEINTPRQRLVTSFGRPVNVAFALAEVLWILAGRNDVEMLEFYNSTISRFSDNGRTFNAAYGFRAQHSFGHDQITDAIMALRADHSSRQVSIIYSNPVDDKAYDRIADGQGGLAYTPHHTKDRACNLLSHPMIRNNRLDWLQVVRSNDAIWGVPYNLMQFTHLQEWIAASVGVPMGRYTMAVDSLHIYEHHFDEARQVREFNLYDYMETPPLMEVGVEVLNLLLREELAIRTARWATTWDKVLLPGAIGTYWGQVLLVLLGWRHYRDRDDAQAWCCWDMAGLYGIAAMRFAYQHRWHQPEYSGIIGPTLAHWTSEAEPVANWLVTRVKEQAAGTAPVN